MLWVEGISPCCRVPNLTYSSCSTCVCQSWLKPSEGKFWGGWTGKSKSLPELKDCWCLSDKIFCFLRELSGDSDLGGREGWRRAFSVVDSNLYCLTGWVQRIRISLARMLCGPRTELCAFGTLQSSCRMRGRERAEVESKWYLVGQQRVACCGSCCYRLHRLCEDNLNGKRRAACFPWLYVMCFLILLPL